jgi:hypothetical protein
MDLTQALQTPQELLVLNQKGMPLDADSLGKMKATHLPQCTITVRGEPLAFSRFSLGDIPQVSFSYQGMATGQRVDDKRSADDVPALEVLGDAYRIATNLPVPYITRDDQGRVIDID